MRGSSQERIVSTCDEGLDDWHFEHGRGWIYVSAVFAQPHYAGGVAVYEGLVDAQ